MVKFYTSRRNPELSKRISDGDNSGQQIHISHDKNVDRAEKIELIKESIYSLTK